MQGKLEVGVKIKKSTELTILFQYTDPYTPQHNGICERGLAVIQEKVRIMLT